MAPVMVQVAGKHEEYLRLGPGNDFFFEERKIALQLGTVDVSIHPMGFCGRQDHAITRLHVVVGDASEVVELRLIDVRFQLDVNSPEPPAVRQPDRKITASLSSLPTPDPSLLAKQSREAHEA